MSLSTVIQGLLVSQLPEYEISNEAIGYLSDFSGKVLNKLVKESAINNNSSISYPEVKVAITKVFPQSWAPLVFREVSNQVSHQQPDDKESMLKNEISDFELIDDGNLSPKVENKHAENLFLSADFIKSYLPASVASRIDSHGCMYLAVSLETVLSKLIQHARRVLENHEDPFVITKEAIERAIYQDTSLTELSNAMSRCPEPSEVDEFEVVEDDEKVSELEFKSQVEEQVNEFIETEEPKYAAEEPAQVPELDSSSVEDDHEVPEPTVKEEATVPEEDEVPAIVPEVTTSDVEEDVPVGIQQPEEPLVAKESDISEPVDADTPSVSESETLLEPSAVELVNLDPSSAKLIKAKKPVTELYGKCCPYFDATSFAIHMLSSIVELFLLHLVSETCGIARPQRRAVKQHVREAFARLTSSQNEIPHSDDSSLFNECVDNSITIVSKQVEWDTDVKTYISDIIMYISSRVLLVAATHARTTGDWVINSNCIASAASHVVPAAPVNKLVKTLKETLEGEGPIITPPPAPRIRAAEMIYLTSLYKETPLQIDNQLLVVFMFLVSLSLHTLCCVK